MRHGGLGRLAVAALVAASFVPWTGCGYSLAGRGAFLPAHIRTIGIPLFANATTVFDAEQLLTQRVRSEFIGRGKYTVVPETAGTDAVLEGQITSITLMPSAFDDQQLATRYLVVVTTSIQFRDTKDKRTIWENPSLVFREEFEVATLAAAGGPIDVQAFFGQGSNALERVANEFARTVVSSILEAF
jgi:hypothetical protein